MSKVKVAFICVHNACRSQMAEALGKALASDAFDSYSAGSETKPMINQDAVRLMKKHFDLDMEAMQYSKEIKDIPDVDVMITMGCNVTCPIKPCVYHEDWGLSDPSGKDDEAFYETMMQIQTKILYLKEQIQKGVITKLR